MRRNVMREKRIACVTGATGFVGYHLSLYLLKEGWRVHAIVRNASNYQKLQNTSREQIHFHNYDEEDLIEILKKIKPQIVFHLAAAVQHEHTYASIEELVQSNITFGTKLLEAMAQNNCRNLINTGTYWQNYKNEEYNPVNLYAATKESFEKIIRYYKEAENFQTITLKLFDTYGPGDSRKKLFNLLSEALRERKELCLTRGEQKIDLVYIDDVIKAYIKAAAYLMKADNEKQGTYVVSGRKTISLKQVVETYEKVVGEKLYIQWGGRNYRKREVMTPWNQGRILPGWKAGIMLEEGIKRMLNKNEGF